jgi:hypothetical protein
MRRQSNAGAAPWLLERCHLVASDLHREPTYEQTWLRSNVQLRLRKQAAQLHPGLLVQQPALVQPFCELAVRQLAHEASPAHANNISHSLLHADVQCEAHPVALCNSVCMWQCMCTEELSLVVYSDAACITAVLR